MTSTRSTTTSEERGFPTVFSVGMLQAGILATYVTDWLGAANVRRFGAQFREQVWPGDTLTCSGTVTKRYEDGGERLVERSSSCARAEPAAPRSRAGYVRRAVGASSAGAGARGPGGGRQQAAAADRSGSAQAGRRRGTSASSRGACCRTDHVVTGELDLPKLPVVPGHQVVGTVDALGDGTRACASGSASACWLHWADGVCQYCRRAGEPV